MSLDVVTVLVALLDATKAGPHFLIRTCLGRGLRVNELLPRQQSLLGSTFAASSPGTYPMVLHSDTIMVPLLVYSPDEAFQVQSGAARLRLAQPVSISTPSTQFFTKSLKQVPNLPSLLPWPLVMDCKKRLSLLLLPFILPHSR